jgi:hypothetical protein
MRLLWLAAALCIPVTASAQDAQLNALKATLASLQSKDPKEAIETLGARPELTIAKHQLRDWIESQLPALTDRQPEQLTALANHINEALKAAGASEQSDDQNLLGSVGDVVVSNEPGLLIVRTAVGILCQYDESAYGYKLLNGRWQRIWESEQNDYSSKKYNP